MYIKIQKFFFINSVCVNNNISNTIREKFKDKLVDWSLFEKN